MSIALFFLLSGFFLATLLGSTERSRKLLGVAGACLAAIACIIIFLKPVQLPPTQVLIHGPSTTTTTAPIPGPPGAAGSGGVVPTTTTLPGDDTSASGTTTTITLEAASAR